MSAASTSEDVVVEAPPPTARACDECRRMKVRCIGKENPPCQRCAALKLHCAFEGPSRVRGSAHTAGDSRLKSAEIKIAELEKNVEQLLHWQQSITMTNHLYSGSANSQSAPMGLSVLVPSRENDSRSTSPPASSSDEYQAEEDPLEEAAMSAPLRNMISIAERARLHADGHLRHPKRSSHERGQNQSPASPMGQGSSKRLKGNHIETTTSNKTPKSTFPREVGEFSKTFADPIDMKFCDEAVGRDLFDFFMSNALVYMPVYDPRIDTWERLRRHRPFSLTAILMVASKIRDAGKPPSVLQLQCKEHAEKIVNLMQSLPGKETLFSPIARIEAVQAMIILASWGDTSWRPGNHALSMGLDMGLNHCLLLLAQSGMGAGKSSEHLEEEQPLVVGARVWIALSKMKYEMSYNSGQPVMLSEDQTLHYGRSFLTHPLSILSDSRLVAALELLVVKLPIHEPFGRYKSAVELPLLEDKIKVINSEAENWGTYWQDYYGDLGMPPNHDYRMILSMQIYFLTLHSNALMLYGIHSKQDVSFLSEERKQSLLRALRASQGLVHITETSGKEKLACANNYMHVALAFAARYLIRVASLLPEAVNLRQTAKDVEKVAHLLAVPGHHFSHQILDVINKARSDHLLPPATTTNSPNQPQHADLPVQDDQDDHIPEFDFSFAEQLFTETQGDTSFMGDGIDMSWMDQMTWFPSPTHELQGVHSNGLPFWYVANRPPE